MDQVEGTLGDCWYSALSAAVGWDCCRGLDGVGTECVYRADIGAGLRSARERRRVRARDILGSGDSLMSDKKEREWRCRCQ